MKNILLLLGSIGLLLSGPRFVAARYYDPAEGRFLSEDPIFHPGRSSYEYAYNNPLKYTDPTGTDAVLVEWNSGGEFHQEVFIGNAMSGYVPIGFSPTNVVSGAWSAGTGQSVSGSVQERQMTLLLPWNWPVIGGRVMGVIKQGSADDATTLAYARALGKLPEWQKYNAYRNSCQDYAQNIFNSALQRQKNR